MIKLGRRRFVTSLTLLPAALAANAGIRQKKNDRVEPCSRKELCRRIDLVIGSWQSIYAVGQQSGPGDALQHGSKQPISPWASGFIRTLTDPALSMDDDTVCTLRVRYRSRIREDFSRNRMLSVSGYMLSTSETEICRGLHDKLKNRT